MPRIDLDAEARVPKAAVVLPLMALCCLRADKTLQLEGSNRILTNPERMFLLAFVASCGMTDDDFDGYPETI